MRQAKGTRHETMSEITELSIPTSSANSTEDSFTIPIKLHQPRHPKLSKAIILLIHGGIFTHGNRHCHPSIAIALAEHNIVITASFRNGLEGDWRSGLTLSDLKDVLKWIERERLEREEWRGLMIGLVGSSSVSSNAMLDKRICMQGVVCK